MGLSRRLSSKSLLLELKMNLRLTQHGIIIAEQLLLSLSLDWRRFRLDGKESNTIVQAPATLPNNIEF